MLQAIRAQQDEMIRLREIEVNEIKSVKLELEHEVRDLRQVLSEVCWHVKLCEIYNRTATEDTIHICHVSVVYVVVVVCTS